MNARHRSILTAISMVVLPLGMTGAASGGISGISGVGTASSITRSLSDGNPHAYEAARDISSNWTQAAAKATTGGYLSSINSAPDDQFIDSLVKYHATPTGNCGIGFTRTGPAAPTASGQVESDNTAATGAAASSVPLPSAALMFFPGAAFAFLVARQMRPRA
jgi:hypothetical protein